MTPSLLPIWLQLTVVITAPRHLGTGNCSSFLCGVPNGEGSSHSLKPYGNALNYDVDRQQKIASPSVDLSQNVYM